MLMLVGVDICTMSQKQVYQISVSLVCGMLQWGHAMLQNKTENTMIC